MMGTSTPIRLDGKQPPILVSVVDTEEEFDWSRGFDTAATSVDAIRHIDRVQSIFDEFGVKPAYVVDYPVASQPDGCLPLREIQDSGRAVIGAHLHPWVNPPLSEEICRRNSYPGNLPADLEEAKIQVLTAMIKERFGTRPVVYKAGRYGVGPHTASILERAGYEVDVSVFPTLDSSVDGGPDFLRASLHPYWFGASRRMLEVPLTGAFVGFVRTGAPTLYALASRPRLAPLRLQGILARLNAVDRLALSPEGFTPDEHLKLTSRLMADGVRVFCWTFHSPSVKPGCTPYVRSTADLERFLDKFRRYFDYFFGELGGVTMTPIELKNLLETAT